MKIISSAHITILALAASFGFASAANAVGPREADALNKATVSLVQATQIAEKHEAGRTIGAEFDIEKIASCGKLRFSVLAPTRN